MAHAVCSPKQLPTLPIPGSSLWMLLYSGAKHSFREISLFGNLVHEGCSFTSILLPNKFPEGKFNVIEKFLELSFSQKVINIENCHVYGQVSKADKPTDVKPFIKFYIF